MEKRPSKLFIAISLTGIFLISVLVMLGSVKVKKEVSVKTNLASDVKAGVQPVEEKLDYLSPDGKYTLTVTNLMNANGLASQTVHTKAVEDGTPVKIFEKETGPENMATVPDNTFSPDNKYVFLKYKESGKNRYIVLRSDGKEIKEGTPSVEIEALFSQNHPEFVITDVTGWGSYSLLVVNTDTADGKTGPSWWFDLSNLSFIRLSSRFN